MRISRLSTADPVTVARATSTAPGIARFLIGAFTLGLLLVLAGVGVTAVFDLEAPRGRGLDRLLDYVGRGVAPIAMTIAIGVVVIGLAMTVVHAVRRTFRAVVGAVRYVIAHDIRHLAGMVAPLVLPGAGFVGFSLLTGGTDAIGYWLLAILATVLLGVFFAYWVGIFVTLFEPVGNLVGRAVAFPLRRFSPKWASRVKEATSTLVRVGPPAVAVSLVWVYHAAALGDAPSRLPWTETGWGQYLGFLVLLLLTWGLAFLGFRLNERWVERPEPATQPPAARTVASQQRRAMVAAPFGRALPVLKPEPPPPEPYWSPEVIPAWRAWVWGEGELRGVWRVWTTADFEAECGTCDEVPGWDHVCGIYAVKDPRQLHVFNRPTARERLVAGRVELSGLIVEHEVGYRAQHARIVELFAPSRLVDDIAAAYPDVAVSPRMEKGGVWPT